MVFWPYPQLFSPVLSLVWPHCPLPYPQIPLPPTPLLFFKQASRTPDAGPCIYSPLCWKWSLRGHLCGFLTPYSLFTQMSASSEPSLTTSFKMALPPQPLSLVSSSPEPLSHLTYHTSLTYCVCCLCPPPAAHTKRQAPWVLASVWSVVLIHPQCLGMY